MAKCGFVNVIKPTGMTSSDVVCAVKKIIGEKKVGHLGTLDPAASGVLPIAVGKAAKFFDYFLKKDKVYVADVKFGVLTDTLDSFGKIIETDDIVIKKEQLESVLIGFVGKIKQVPPLYSAIKVNGKKACDLARNGEIVELKKREIEIYSIELLDEIDVNTFRFRVHCTAGTYIRTLFNDIAVKLGTIATTPVIIREKSGSFDTKNAVTLDEFRNNPSLIAVEQLFTNCKIIDISDAVLSKKLLNGVRINKNDGFNKFDLSENEEFFIRIDNKLVGMYRFLGEKLDCIVFLSENN